MGVCGPLEGGRIGWELVVHWKVGELGQFWGASGRLEDWVCVWGGWKVVLGLSHH